MHRLPKLLLVASTIVALGCGQDGAGSSGGAATSGPAGSGGAAAAGGAGGEALGGGGAGGQGGRGDGGFGVGGDIDKSQDCTDVFGSGMTPPYGRIDGTLLSVVKPDDVQCPEVNDDHVVLEIVTFGDVYRMVVNVQSTYDPPEVDYDELHAPLPAPAWAEGWHTDATAKLDYPSMLGVHSDQFTPFNLDDLSNIITHRVELGAPISVYGLTDGGSSGHEVHRNDDGAFQDGAIVVDPTSSDPLFLLFRFDEQTF